MKKYSMRNIGFFIVALLFAIPLFSQVEKATNAEILDYVRANPGVLSIVKKNTGHGVEDDKGRTVIPPEYYRVSILATTSKVEEPKFLVSKKCEKYFNLLALDNTPLFSSHQHVMIQAAPGYVIVTPPTKDTSFVVDYNGNPVDKLEKWMIEDVIVKKYSPANEAYYVIGKNGQSGYHSGLLSNDLKFIKPLSDHQIKVQEHGIIIYSNSGNEGTLYDLNMKEIWSSKRAIPTHVFENTFVYSNQSNYTGGILNFEGDTLFTSELMRFSDRDIKDGVIKYSTHLSYKQGVVSVDGEEIIPAGDVSMNWRTFEGKNYLLISDKEKGKKIRYYPLENRFVDD